MKKIHMDALRAVIRYTRERSEQEPIEIKGFGGSGTTWSDLECIARAEDAVKAIRLERHNGFNAARRSVIAILKRDGTLTMPDGSYSHVLPEQLREWLGEKLK
jgi:hypothetical protein